MKPPRPTRRTTALVVGVVVLALVLIVVVGAGVLVVRRLTTSPQERYCAEVVARRTELTGDLSQAKVGLITALPVLEDLRDDAPRDIADDWDELVRAVSGLSEALDAAGVDPATYDRDDPPAGLSDSQRTAIDDAATILGSLRTRNALLGIDQHARDVCGTPLTQ